MRATLPASIRLEEEIAPAPPVIGDPSQLQQVIVNLVTNAAQAIGEAQGTITVSLRPRRTAHCSHLAVADTGCGMDEATLARDLRAVLHDEAGRRRAPASASPWSHGIVKDHGGRIEVESSPAAAPASTSSCRRSAWARWQRFSLP